MLQEKVQHQKAKIWKVRNVQKSRSNQSQQTCRLPLPFCNIEYLVNPPVPIRSPSSSTAGPCRHPMIPSPPAPLGPLHIVMASLSRQNSPPRPPHFLYVALVATVIRCSHGIAPAASSRMLSVARHVQCVKLVASHNRSKGRRSALPRRHCTAHACGPFVRACSVARNLRAALLPSITTARCDNFGRACKRAPAIRRERRGVYGTVLHGRCGLAPRVHSDVTGAAMQR